MWRGKSLRNTEQTISSKELEFVGQLFSCSEYYVKGERLCRPAFSVTMSQYSAWNSFFSSLLKILCYHHKILKSSFIKSIFLLLKKINILQFIRQNRGFNIRSMCITESMNKFHIKWISFPLLCKFLYRDWTVFVFVLFFYSFSEILLYTVYRLFAFNSLQ